MFILLIWKLFGLKAFYETLSSEKKTELRKAHKGSWLEVEELCYEKQMRNELSRPVNAFVLELKGDVARVCMMRHNDPVGFIKTLEFDKDVSELRVSFGTVTKRLLKEKFFPSKDKVVLS